MPPSGGRARLVEYARQRLSEQEYYSSSEHFSLLQPTEPGRRGNLWDEATKLLYERCWKPTMRTGQYKSYRVRVLPP